MKTPRWLAPLLLPLLLGACQQEAQGQQPSTPPAPVRPPVTDVTSKDYVSPPLPRAHVRLKDAFGGVHRVEVEVAATPDSRQRGLMWRTELAEGKGMLFLFPSQEMQGFWMRNTLISLDIIFITSDLHIAGVVSRAVPKTLDSRSVGAPSQYVLEVPAGWAEKKGVRKGAQVEFEGVSTISIAP
ncbi:MULTISPECIES: DUF192 domain-containing protein [Myxococcus]|uniref:DUF192 domain-containing protein n=1 Tax=Myxococcus llanfairpwllgwyngyllgogerychwyrndrobwllllantysiliogogogochensis TaxID=2590453 RepID=A0A540WMI6_9BACT|nr:MULTISPECIES: DUF192 domain-containing protein [Myxococcus]NTX04207.1 DUF192 domain-containing protein [Myxococcus sp. CA040A]TQF10228.1 DUF192 domain-containing protein [Myxococcus llanfairpwllgwyngyllgogerychwyrndrobwllllantysiliogogogochensis]